MRCNNCGKFVSQEMADPEVVDSGCHGGTLTATVRIVAQCAECSDDLKETTFDVDEEIEGFCDNANHEKNVDEVTLESTERGEGKGRYRKTFYGAEGVFEVSCSCGKKAEHKWSDAIQASHMDEA